MQTLLDALSRRLLALREAGRVLSAANEAKVRAAIEQLESVLAGLGVLRDDMDAEPADEARRLEEARAMLRKGESMDAMRMLVSDAIRQKAKTARETNPDIDAYPYVQDLYGDNTAIYQQDGRAWQVAYTIDRTTDTAKVLLGEPVEVEVCYVPVGEAARRKTGAAAESAGAVDLTGDCIALLEKAIRRDGTVPIKVIAPGRGSSGYYTTEALKASGPKVFTKGLHLYWDHPTATEESERPERSLRDLAGVLESDARYEESGPAGPGLYADAKVFPAYQTAIESLAPHIGVSIRASGRGQRDAVAPDGKAGPVIEGFVAAKSVDFVTAPGAGGQVLSLFEAARSGRQASAQTAPSERTDGANAAPSERQSDTSPTPPQEEATEVTAITAEEAQQLRESLATEKQAREAQAAELGRLRESLALRDARDLALRTLATTDLPAASRARLCDTLVRLAPITEAGLDVAAFKTLIDTTATAEVEYLAAVTGSLGSGAIRGMGSAPSGSVTREAAEQQLGSAFARLGLSEAGRPIAVAGRA